MKIYLILISICAMSAMGKKAKEMSERDREKMKDFMFLDDELDEDFQDKPVYQQAGDSRARRANPSNKLDDYANFMGDAEEYRPNCFNETEFFQKRIMPQALRWVRMFLRYSKLGDIDLTPIKPGTKIYASLNFNINVDNLRALQDLKKSTNPRVTMSELDEYLSDIMFNPVLRDIDDFLTWTQRKFSHIVDAVKTSDTVSFLSTHVSHVSHMSHEELTHFVSRFAYAALCIGALYRYFWARVPFKKVIIQLVVSLTAVEVFLQYLSELKKEEEENYWKLKQFTNRKSECNPENQGWGTKIWNWVMWRDPCLDFLKNKMHIDTTPRVTILQCILKCSLANLIELPFTMAVELAMKMATKVGGGGFYGHLIYPAVFIFMLGFIILIFMVLTGLKFKLAVWPFTSMEFYFPETGTRAISTNSAESPAVQTRSDVVVPTINITNNIIPPRRRSTSARLRIGASPRPTVSRQISAPVVRAIMPDIATEKDIDEAMMRESDEEVQAAPQVASSSSSNQTMNPAEAKRDRKVASNNNRSEANVEKSVEDVSEIIRGIAKSAGYCSLSEANVEKLVDNLSEIIRGIAVNRVGEGIGSMEGVSGGSRPVTDVPDLGSVSEKKVEKLLEGVRESSGDVADAARADQIQIHDNRPPDDWPSMTVALELEQSSSFLLEWLLLLTLLEFLSPPVGVFLFLAFQIPVFLFFNYGFLRSVVLSSMVVTKRSLLGLPVEIPHQFENNWA